MPRHLRRAGAYPTLAPEAISTERDCRSGAKELGLGHTEQVTQQFTLLLSRTAPPADSREPRLGPINSPRNLPLRESAGSNRRDQHRKAHTGHLQEKSSRFGMRYL